MRDPIPVEQIPRVVDDDIDQIMVWLDGQELRAWSYQSEPERRFKILCAREYVEGWCDATVNTLKRKGELH